MEQIATFAQNIITLTNEVEGDIMELKNDFRALKVRNEEIEKELEEFRALKQVFGFIVEPMLKKIGETNQQAGNGQPNGDKHGTVQQPNTSRELRPVMKKLTTKDIADLTKSTAASNK